MQITLLSVGGNLRGRWASTFVNFPPPNVQPPLKFPPRLMPLAKRGSPSQHSLLTLSHASGRACFPLSEYASYSYSFNTEGGRCSLTGRLGTSGVDAGKV